MLPHLNDFNNYLLSNGYSSKTISNYNRDLSAFESFLILKDIKFKDIKRKTIDSFKGILRTPDQSKLFTDALIRNNRAKMPQNESKNNKGVNPHLKDINSVEMLSSSSINRMLSSLRKYFRYLIINDYFCPIPPDKIEFVKREKKITNLTDFENFVKLIEFPTVIEKNNFVKLRNRAFLELLFSTGMRISEACNLNIDQVGKKDLLNKNFLVNEKVFITGKGKKQRFVYLTPRAQYFLSEYLNIRDDDLPAVFIPQKGTRKNSENPLKIRVSTNYFQMKIAQYRKLLGINVKTSAHSLRHGFATFMADNGASVAALQTLLGHESLTTTTRYLHTSQKLAEDTQKEHHPLSNLDL